MPVELSSFTANVIGSNVQLKWRTQTEVNNYGFDIERKENNNHNSQWQKLTFIQGNGNSNSPKDYSFIDKDVKPGKYSYRLKQIDNDGRFEYFNTADVNLSSINEFELVQNYPNPFNPTTTISFNLPEASNVKLTVSNILGQEIKTLVNEHKEAGVHSVEFNASDLPSGFYIYRIEAGKYVQTRKMLLVK